MGELCTKHLLRVGRHQSAGAEEDQLLQRPRNSFVPSYRPIQEGAGSHGVTLPWSSYLRARVRGRAYVRGSEWVEREREEVSNQAKQVRPGATPVMRRAHPLPSIGSVHESIHIEGCRTLEHVVGRTAEAGGQDAERLALAMLGADALEQTLASRVLLEEADCDLAEGPLEMGVADLVSRRSEHLAGRGLLALHQPGIGEEVLDPGKALDVVELVEERESEDGADTGDRLEELERVGILDSRLPQSSLRLRTKKRRRRIRSRVARMPRG